MIFTRWGSVTHMANIHSRFFCHLTCSLPLVALSYNLDKDEFPLCWDHSNFAFSLYTIIPDTPEKLINVGRIMYFLFFQIIIVFAELYGHWKLRVLELVGAEALIFKYPYGCLTTTIMFLYNWVKHIASFFFCLGVDCWTKCLLLMIVS